MRNRILTLVNLLLIAACGFLAWYLATQNYQQPPEFREALAYFTETTSRPTETRMGPPALRAETSVKTTSVPPSVPGKPLFPPIWTPTPTPKPTPTPTPPPPDLATATQSWEINSIIDDKTAEFNDRRANDNAGEPFTLTVGGPPRETIDKDNRPIPVSLISVDLDNSSVILGYQDQKYPKKMFE